MRRNLIVFLRYPEPGKAKERLIPNLGAEGAAALAHELARNALSVVRVAAAEQDLDISVWYTGCDESRARELGSGDYSYHRQPDGDLGSRMSSAFTTAFAEGYDQVALVGTDCPEIDEAVIEEAFECLNDSDVVIGPSRDGGYYLIALRVPAPGLFEGIPWESPDVIDATVRAADGLGLSTEGLAILWEVSRSEDLIDYELYKTREALLT